MAHAGQEIKGPNGYRLRLIRTAAETDGELLEMEAIYAGTGELPPEHLHPHQAEHFEVIEGRILAVVEGVEHRYTAGETFDVPVRTPHQMAGDGPARVRWEIRPAMRTAEFFERLYGEGPDSPSGGGSVDQLFADFREEIERTG
jgi:quercetin dioxygenase-like cupin family protein